MLVKITLTTDTSNILQTDIAHSAKTALEMLALCQAMERIAAQYKAKLKTFSPQLFDQFGNFSPEEAAKVLLPSASTTLKNT